MNKLEINLPKSSYSIYLGNDDLSSPPNVGGFPLGSAAVVVSDKNVFPLYGKKYLNYLNAFYPRVLKIVLVPGEQFKHWETLNEIFSALLRNACDRDTVLFALGGGVIGDMTGFAAATYMRGVRFVQIPTTLLAQVDSSVGGKTGINHPLGKNMIGAFYQPQMVICDLNTLKTLPPRELSAGLAEVIKYGPIADMVFFEWLETNMDSLVAVDMEALAHVVQRSCEIKARVVGLDERESGIRAILNFGHTFGHAIEAGLGFGVWLHGEAVGCGMVMAAHLSQRLGLVDMKFVQRLTTLISRAGLPIRAPALGVARYLELMRVDKKAKNGEIRFVLIDGPGAGRAVLRTAPDMLVGEVIELCCV